MVMTMIRMTVVTRMTTTNQCMVRRACGHGLGRGNERAVGVGGGAGIAAAGGEASAARLGWKMMSVNWETLYWAGRRDNMRRIRRLLESKIAAASTWHPGDQ
jgi:hypothetical protein